jgi:hypothetical protein
VEAGVRAAEAWFALEQDGRACDVLREIAADAPRTRFANSVPYLQSVACR